MGGLQNRGGKLFVCQKKACNQQGYKGRTGVFELLTIDERFKQAVTDRMSLHELKRLAVDAGMQTLAEEGKRLVSEGVTTAVELERVIHG